MPSVGGEVSSMSLLGLCDWFADVPGKPKADIPARGRDQPQIAARPEDGEFTGSRQQFKLLIECLSEVA